MMRVSPAVAAALCALCLSAWTSSAGPDKYEPDNVRTAARKLDSKVSQHHSIHAAGDTDWLTFTLAGLGANNLTLETSGKTLSDTEISLYTRNGTFVRYDDDSGDGKYSLLAMNSLARGTYTVRIREYGNDGTIPSYWLRARWNIVPITHDAYEPDNYSSAAKTIINGHTQNRTIHLAGNVDWAKFTVTEAGARDVRVETAGTGGDTEMWLYKPNSAGTGAGKAIAYNNDGGVRRFSRVTVPALFPGTYFIKIQENGNNADLPAYTLQAAWTTIPILPDEFENDSISGRAKVIANGVRQDRTIHAAGNVDWAKFTIGEAGAHSVRIETSGRSGDTQLWLYKQSAAGTSAGKAIAYNNNGGSGNFDRIELSSLAAGTYYVRVQEYANDGKIPTYALRVSWVNAPYDPRFPLEIDGPITWLHTDVSGWAETSTLTANISNGKINFPHSKANVWPPGYTHDLYLYGNPWVIVKWRDGKWYAATFEWLRPGQTAKPVGVLDGSKGDHIKRSPLSGWRPRKGERFGIMVSGLARGGARNVEERTNVSMVTWPY